MNTTTTLARIDELQEELNAIEAKMDPNLFPAAQDALDDEWDHAMAELEMLTELLANELEDDRGCETCSGCTYCEDMGMYDPADEI